MGEITYDYWLYLSASWLKFQGKNQGISLNFFFFVEKLSQISGQDTGFYAFLRPPKGAAGGAGQGIVDKSYKREAFAGRKKR